MRRRQLLSLEEETEASWILWGDQRPKMGCQFTARSVHFRSSAGISTPRVNSVMTKLFRKIKQSAGIN
jgi:hypothetical protein